MNIFFLHETPKLAAKYHCDKHVIKMILESAQLLSTAHRVLDGRRARVVSDSGRNATRYVLPNQVMEETLYTATHIEHPCARWVRESDENYYWLYELMLELNKEFVRRYNKSEPHLTIIKLEDKLRYPPKRIPCVGFTTPPKCMPDEYKVDDVVMSYRNYYIGAKADMAKWTLSLPPPWFQRFKIS